MAIQRVFVVNDHWKIAKCVQRVCLKEYYDIVDEARPLLGIFPTHADFVTELHF